MQQQPLRVQHTTRRPHKHLALLVTGKARRRMTWWQQPRKQHVARRPYMDTEATVKNKVHEKVAAWIQRDNSVRQ